LRLFLICYISIKGSLAQKNNSKKEPLNCSNSINNAIDGYAGEHNNTIDINHNNDAHMSVNIFSNSINNNTNILSIAISRLITFSTYI